MVITQSRETQNKHAKAGFTLIEIIIAMAIIGALVALIYPQITKMQQKAKIGQAKTSLTQIKQAIDMYQTDIDEYPKTLEDLVRRPAEEPAHSKWTTGGYLSKDKVPTDPWGKKFVYKLNGPDAEPPYELYSYGPNGQKAPKVEWIRA
jgi:general secretion pathway protein G